MQRRSFLRLGSALALPQVEAPETAAGIVDRAVFVAKLNQLAEVLRRVRVSPSLNEQRAPTGLTRDLVQSLLGAPDLTLREGEPSDLAEEWYYGVAGRTRTPTLGAVGFNQQGRLQYLWGAGAVPPTGAVEARWREVLPLLSAVPSAYHSDPPWNPLLRLQAINALQGLGATRAWRVLQEGLRLKRYTWSGGQILHEPYGICTLAPFLYCRGGNELLAAPCGEMPLVLFEGVPLLLRPELRGGIVGGYPIDWNAWASYPAEGTFLRRPLRPPDQPLTLFERLSESPLWPRLSPAADLRLRTAVKNQLLRLVAEVYSPPLRRLLDGRKYLLETDPPLIWDSFIRDFDRLGIRWDAASRSYRTAGEPV